MKNKLISLLLLSISIPSFAVEQLSPEIVNGTYHLSVPERGKSQVLMQYGQLGAKTVIAVAACKRCTPAVYSYLDEESKTLGVPVFTTSGLYLIRYNSDSFVLVQADGVLGRKVWLKIGHANVYSKNNKTAKATTRQTMETFAIDLSSKIMNQDIGQMVHASGKYHLAAPQSHGGKAQTSYQIELNSKGKKTISVKPCERCSSDLYHHMPDESGIVGLDVYRHSSSHYLFDLKDGVLLYTFSNASGLGKTLWGENSHFNVYSNNKAYIREIIASEEKQQIIDGMMGSFFKDIKTEFERRAKEEQQQKVAIRELPREVLVYANKDQLLTAAKSWASAWNWVETIENAYLTQSDWSIRRNKLTGTITGKIIGGIITMKHPDGRCRYQTAGFRQDFDGSQYMNLHVMSIGPIYDLKCDKF